MVFPVVLPRQGQSVETCIITAIYKQIGDQVEQGDSLFAYETDKASFEAEAPQSGELLMWFVAPGDEVPVLSNVAVIGDKGESFEEFKPSKGSADPTENNSTGPDASEASNASKITSALSPHESPGSTTAPAGLTISPRARSLAEKLGVFIEGINGTGPRGRIIERDIMGASERQAKLTPLAKKIQADYPISPPASGTSLGGRVGGQDILARAESGTSDAELIPLSNIRRRIARAMLNSMQNSAQLTHHLSANAQNLLNFRKKIKEAQQEGYPHNITLNDMICYVIIQSLIIHPRLNAHFLGDQLKVFKKVHLGMAVDTERGLMVPSIRHADELGLQEFSAQAKQLAKDCRQGSVNPDLLPAEVAGFTVSNLGNYGIEMFTPIINLPQVAILGVNTIIPRPVAQENNTYGFAPYLGLSLSYDHRALDGGEASRFLQELARGIENFNEKL